MAFVVLSLLYQGTTFDGFGYHLDHLHSAKECIVYELNKDLWNFYAIYNYSLNVKTSLKAQ